MCCHCFYCESPVRRRSGLGNTWRMTNTIYRDLQSIDFISFLQINAFNWTQTSVASGTLTANVVFKRRGLTRILFVFMNKNALVVTFLQKY